MKNFKYHLMLDRGSNEIVVSQKEHEAIQEIVSKGGGLVRFRGGVIGFHTSSIKAFRETNEYLSVDSELLTLKGPPGDRLPVPKKAVKKLGDWVKKQPWAQKNEQHDTV